MYWIDEAPEQTIGSALAEAARRYGDSEGFTFPGGRFSFVKQAAVVPAPDRRLGEVVVAFIELRVGARANDKELIAHCKAQLASYKVPRAVHFVTEWPMSGTGKIQKRLLLQLLPLRTIG